MRLLFQVICHTLLGNLTSSLTAKWYIKAANLYTVKFPLFISVHSSNTQFTAQRQ
jgi:hypothetical protein